MNFDFFMPVKVIFGQDRKKDLGKLVGGRKTMIVTDAVMVKLGLIDSIKACIDAEVIVFDGIEPNPTVESVNEAARIGRAQKIECVIGVGGGSSMDAAKAIATMITAEGDFDDYFYGTRLITNKRVGLYVMPTTSGTGSEVTSVGVFTDKKKNFKKPFLSNEFFVDAAILDSTLTHTMPKRVTAVTGFDAFCHAIEAYWSVNAQPISDGAGLLACDLVIRNLKKAFDDGSDSTARDNMAMASLMAGVAFSQTRTTACHGISYPLTTYGKFDHGSACAITLVSFIRFNYSVATEKMDRLIAFCGFKSNDELADFMQNLMEYTGMITKLSAAGIDEGMLDTIVDEGFAHNLTKLNPRVVDKDSLSKILKALF